MQKVDFSLILACYNESTTFEKSVREIVSVLNNLKRNWEIIFVEDKSTDETKKSVEEFTKEIKNSRAIFHTKNEGRGKSVSDGIRTAKGIICGYLDVDLEVSASYIPLFIEEIEKGYDMVVGKRFYESNFRSVARFIASRVYAFGVKQILNIPIEDTEAGYKFFKRYRILLILSSVHDKHWFWDTEICARAYWSGLKISEIPILFERRTDKKSTVRMIPHTINYIRNLIRLKAKLKSQNAKLQIKI